MVYIIRCIFLQSSKEATPPKSQAVWTEIRTNKIVKQSRSRCDTSFAGPTFQHDTCMQKLKHCLLRSYMSRDMRFPTTWYVPPAKPQISLRIRAVWSEPFLVAWILLKFQATNQTSSGISMPRRRLHRLVWVHARRNATLLEITCCGSYIVVRCMYIFTDYFTIVSIESNQTAPTGAVRCGSKLNVINGLKRNLEQFGS